jgi:hypothetical protein
MPINPTPLSSLNPEATQSALEDSDPTPSAQPAPLFKATEFDAVFGRLKSPIGPLSIEDMDEAVVREARESMLALGTE